MDAADVVALVSRWVHILSAVTLLGAMFFARVALVPASQTGLLARFRGVAGAAIAGLALSGLYNLLTKAAVPPGYHAIFGVKFLLALHVFAVAWLSTGQGADDSKRARWVTGVMFSGIAIVLLSGVLRWLSH
ncbi:MAG: hypothetical protein U0Q16_13380 [Bryobacteraceae bacterium]